MMRLPRHARRRGGPFATLAEAGLIDDFLFLISPTALGQDKALFASITKPLRLRPVGTRVFSTGNTLLTFVREDEPLG